MLKRRIEGEIVHWLEESRKALIVSGARQVGKTFTIRAVLNERKADFAEFNLIRDRQVLEVLRQFSTIDDLILKLSLFSPKKLIPHKTVIFFDEIQEFPEIVTVVKFLVEDGRFRYVLSGSLLGVEIRNIRSAPVGSLQSLTMYPLDLGEFLQLFNLSPEVAEHLRDCYEQKRPVDPSVHERMDEIFHLYLIIGGMPAAVETYRRTNNIDDVMAEHRAIIEQYKQDFTKYEAEDRRLFLTRIYDLIPSELNEKNKRFNISDVQKAARFDRVREGFLWLTAAGVALPCYNVTAPALPLALNEKASLFKLFLSDVGMLTSLYGRAVKLQIVTRQAVNKGAVFENVIAQELTAHGYPIYYYASKKWGELDFVLEHDGKVLPIEVKSGKDYTRHSALNNVLQVRDYELSQAVVFSSANVETKGKITYYPAYMVMFLQEGGKESGVLPLSRFSF